MKSHVLAALATVSMLATGCIIVEESTLTVDNESSYVITEIYLTPVDSPTWGPDLLGSTVLYPGDRLEITNIECDEYDAMVIDELGASCYLDSIDLCFDDARWIITDSDLAFCDQWGSLSASDLSLPLRPDALPSGDEI